MWRIIIIVRRESPPISAGNAQTKWKSRVLKIQKHSHPSKLNGLLASFFTIGIYCLTRSLNFALLGWGWGKDTQKDIITYRLNRPKGCVKQAIDNNHSDQRTTAELLQDQSRTNGDMINTGVKRGMALIRRPTMIASPSTGKEGTNGIVLFHDSPIGNAVAVCNAPKRPKQQARKLCSVNNDKRVRREP